MDLRLRSLPKPFRRNRPSLSVVCGTHQPGALVAACLKPLRSIADEIVIGADERVSDADLRWYGSVADQLVTFPFTGPNQFRGWLRDLCNTEWILFLDGDETASKALLDRVPELLSNRDVAAYRLRRHWIWPDASHVLDSLPWSADFQTRLVRNDDRLWFPSLKHTGPSSTGPTARVQEPMLHLDLVITDLPQRESKVARYESELFGHLSRGNSTNRLYYLPEENDGIRIADLAEADRALVRELVSASQGNVAPPKQAARVTKRASVLDIQRTLPQSPFSDEDAKAQITVLSAPTHVIPADSLFTMEVQVRNRGGRVWPAGSDRLPAVRCSYQWRDSAGQMVHDGVRTVFPHPVRPGARVDLECVVETPADPVGLELVLDVVAECDRWFGVDVIVPVHVGSTVRDQLSAESADGLVPFAKVLEMRRLLSRSGEIERQLSDPDPQVALPHDIAEQINGLAVGAWALDAAVLDLLIRTYRDTQPDVALEFGSGTSTVVLALLAEQAGRDGVSVISIEQDPQAADKIRTELDGRGLSKLVRVVVAPLAETSVGGLQLKCYDDSALAAGLEGLSPELILVDGPSAASGGNRYPTLLLLQQHLTSPAVFILDDAWRDVELSVAERWQGCPGIEIDGIAPVGKGAVVGRIGPVLSM